MIAKAWVIVLVDRSELHQHHRLVARWCGRTIQLKHAALFGSKGAAEKYIADKTDELPQRVRRNTPAPWGTRWLPVPVQLTLELGENVSALLDVHAELA